MGCPARSGCDARPGCDVQMRNPAWMFGFFDQKSKDAQPNPFSKVRYLCSEVDLWKISFGTLLRISMYYGRIICQSYVCKYKAYAYKMCQSRFLRFFLCSPAPMLGESRGYVGRIPAIAMHTFYMHMPYICINTIGRCFVHNT